MTEIIPGIHQFKVPIANNPLGHTNIYLLQGDGGYVMIDAGIQSDEATKALRQQLAEAAIDLSRIATLIITHGHGDHIGLAGYVREITGARIAMHAIEIARLPAALQNPMARWTNDWLRSSGIPDNNPPDHQPPHSYPLPPHPDISLEDGQIIDRFDLNLRVLLTPGHAPGHICLYDIDRKILFSGDHILPVTTPNIGLRPGGTGMDPDNNPLVDYLESLEKVNRLDVETVLPAHEFIFTDLQSRVAALLAHHRQRNEEIMATLAKSPKTAYQISEDITWMPETGGVKFHNLHYWNQRMAVSETLAHLQALRTFGKVVRFGRDGVVYYQVSAG
jgi:glyoxylase-like metal-dependent hydrolase (beta-lactamase superfamily II)